MRISFFWRNLVLVPVLVASTLSYISPSMAYELASVSQGASSQEEVVKNFDQLVEEYFAFCFEASPSWGTQAGFHEYDKKLEDLSSAKVNDNVDKARDFVRRFSDKKFDKLPRDRAIDRLMLINAARYQVFDHEDMHSLAKDPDRYSSLIADSLFGLAKRDFAPLAERYDSVIARMEQAPALLKAARQNIKPEMVPQVYAEVAIEQLPGTIAMVKTTIPEAFSGITDKAALERFEKAQKVLLDELNDYLKFIKEQVLPRTQKSFAIGSANYQKKLELEEMEERSLSVLLDGGYRELGRLQKRFIALGRQINPKLTASQVFEEIASEHPRAEELVSSTQNCLDRLRAYCIDKNIVTVPSQEKVTVAESPSFLRALTFASMDTPGPYESKAKEAFYYVTPAESSWDAKRIEEHLRFFSYADIINTSVHEAYPGHYVQFLWVKFAPSKTRKLIGCSSNAEGWAHYCEEMMIAEGLTQKDGQTTDPKLAMVQVHDALLRVCRYIVGIEMHTKGMSFDRGVEFFMKEGYVEKANAIRETKRGTKDPTYLVYTLGKLQILALRDDFRKKFKDKSLKDFHDQFLKCGFPPLKLVRAQLLEEDLPPVRN